jgi:hypothetical protein
MKNAVNLLCTVLAAGTISFAVPARAQTYDPNYPVCLLIYDDMVDYYFECRYTSIALRGFGVGPVRPVRGQSIFCQAWSAQKAVPQVTASLTPRRRMTPEAVIGPRFARTRWAPTRPAGLKPRAHQQQIRRARHYQRYQERDVQSLTGRLEGRSHGGGNIRRFGARSLGDYF